MIRRPFSVQYHSSATSGNLEIKIVFREPLPVDEKRIAQLRSPLEYFQKVATLGGMAGENIPPTDSGLELVEHGQNGISELYWKAEDLVFPENEEEVVKFVNEAGKGKQAITISGARTGIVGGAIPYSGAILSTEKMKKIINIRKDAHLEQWYIRVQPGLTLRELNQIIKNKREIKLDIPGWQAFQRDDQIFFYPPDPTEDTASLGGTVATNASGARSYRYGSTRKYTNGLRVVLANGEVISLRRGPLKTNRPGSFKITSETGYEIEIKIPGYVMPKVKHTAGYYVSDEFDLIDLFIGSEGTLGIFTEIELTLLPAPPQMF
ncbi:MAG: FAD-binding oxidoreductase [bacterium]